MRPFAAACMVLLAGFALRAESEPEVLPSAPPADAMFRQSVERSFLRSLARDQIAMARAPLRLRWKDMRWLLPLGAATAVLAVNDNRISSALPNTPDQVHYSRRVAEVGALYTTGGMVAALYVGGWITKNDKARTTGLMGAEALAMSTVAMGVMKFAAGRQRPLQTNAGDFARGGSSFPSGHAMGSWAVATIVARQYDDRPLVKWGSYGLAAAISASRLSGRNHFVSDVLVGGVLGHLIGNYVFRTRVAEGEASRLRSLTPAITPVRDSRSRTTAIAVNWGF